MDRKKIEDSLNKIFKEKFLIDMKKVPDRQKECSLLDKEFGLMPRDLIVLFFELQKVFNVEFQEEDITNTRFDYYYNIIDIIYKKQACAC
ncbi:hypothetical protein EHE19_006010 [Ruminiclostridium herbifermentans]|uniref:Peptide maturation system acyl carrier-related protein n=1 Tax=Ruminiclostridium herbifermentans TaxID=2488810 RepID=A0A4U7JEB6_9FIRM|nr:hypothetical protein [Ruminiclostridium herbifermentans]QNU67996.1 hypothetical protein EHE19_006010 [Ruminiclostridium herbifermentans]